MSSRSTPPKVCNLHNIGTNLFSRFSNVSPNHGSENIILSYLPQRQFSLTTVNTIQQHSANHDMSLSILDNITSSTKLKRQRGRPKKALRVPERAYNLTRNALSQPLRPQVSNQPTIGHENKKNIDPHIVKKQSEMLYNYNTHAKSFLMARQRLNQSNVHNLKLRLIENRSTDGRIYNQPIVSEVAALIVDDVDTADERDIIMQRQGGKLKRIDDFHARYLAYQYPLIFLYGEDGYRSNVSH
ncbi:hypothetical protein KIW84_051775 [Lathyrus oleraceus]|uniref:Uncharacterized protein n=1 Tax=Pisum sativum TaxID=3888 RepID=A0A9D4WLX6_PEA|nr:hypothetical protein KIW84_051775 [Pisum sativum]